MPLFTNWLEPLQGLLSDRIRYGTEDEYDRYSRVEYAREHRDFQRVIAERMRSRVKRKK